MALNYTGIRADLVTLLNAADFSSCFTAANRITKVRILEEAMIAEMALNQMPFINVRLDASDSELRSIPNGYYEYIQFEIGIAAFDFTSFRDASILRDSVLRIARDKLQANPHFSVGIGTSRLDGRIKFGAAAAESGGHVAEAIFNVVAEADIDAT